MVEFAVQRRGKPNLIPRDRTARALPSLGRTIPDIDREINPDRAGPFLRGKINRLFQMIPNHGRIGDLDGILCDRLDQINHV